jgi:hypothetical protein
MDNATKAPQPVNVPTIPASFEEDSDGLIVVRASWAEGVRERKRAGVIVSSEDMDLGVSWSVDSLVCGRGFVKGRGVVCLNVIAGRIAVTIVALN